MTNLLRWACQDKRLERIDLNVYETVIFRSSAQYASRENDVVCATSATLARWVNSPTADVECSLERLCRFGYLLPYDIGYRVAFLLPNEGEL